MTPSLLDWMVFLCCTLLVLLLLHVLVLVPLRQRRLRSLYIRGFFASQGHANTTSFGP